MALGRTVLMAWLLAVLSMDFATAAYSEVPVFIGMDVTLPCSCSNTTVRVTWQVGDTVVNHYNKAKKKTHDPHASYKNRSVFPAIEEGQCYLRLFKVSESDEKNYTCYTVDENKSFKDEHVYLKVSRKLEGDPTQSPDLPQTMVGTSLSLVAVMVIILAFIIIGILLMRRRRQNQQRMDNHLDPQSGLPIMNHSPV